MSSIVDNTIFTPNPFASSILGDDNVFDTYLLDKRVGTGVLDQYGGASAAYSLYDLGNKRGTVVETGETVYGDFVTYESDFSGDADGWTASAGAVAGNIDAIGGKDDNLRFTTDTNSSNIHRIVKSTVLTIGVECTISFDVYIPSTNNVLRGIRFADSGNGLDTGTTYYDSITQDSWETITVSGTSAGATITIRSTSSSSTTYQDATGTDVFYIRNVRVTELDTYRTLDVAYHNPAVRLRRDSDNIHKSFPAGAFTQMLNWANEIGHNMLKYSEKFDNGVWTNAGVTVTPNATTDPDGGSTADRLVSTSATASTYQLVFDAKPNTTYTGSVYLKNNGGTSLKLYIWDRDSGNSTTREVISEINSSTWTRVEISVTTGSLADRLYLYVGYNQNSDSDVFAWGAQINIGSSAGTYLKTEATASEGSAYATTWYDQSGVEVTETLAKGDIGNGNLDTAGSPTFDGWGNYAAGTTTIERDTVNQRSGLSCCKITLDGSSSNGFISKAGLISGEVYRVSCWAKSDDGGKLLMDINSPSDPDAVFVLTSDWVKYERYAVSDGTSLTLGREYTSSAGSTILIDDVEIEQLNKAHNDAIQSTASRQPKVVTAGTLVSDANGNYSLDFDGTDDTMTATPGITGQPISTFSVTETDSAATQQGIWGDGTASFSFYRSTGFHALFGATAVEGAAYVANTVYIKSSILNGASSSIAVDGSNTTGLNAGTNGWSSGTLNIGKYSTNFLNGRMATLIAYPTDQSANRSAIEQILSNTIKTALS
jgi:hypothetical protein